MRFSRALPFVLGGIILIGAVVVVAVAVANYDGRTPAEIARDERGENPVALKRCPKNELGNSEEAHDPGTEGKTVPLAPSSALICSWSEKSVRGERPKVVLSEKVLRDRGELTKLTDALNALPPVTPLPEGEYSCESEPSYYVLLGLRYEGSAEIHVGIGPGICGGDAALNLQDLQEYEDTPRLLRLLGTWLEPAS